MTDHNQNQAPENQSGRLLEILAVSTKLGLTSFGGPIAHLAYFHTEYVRRKKWIDEKSYADLVALCQFLPGPASSQIGIGIGTLRGGILGGILAWIGFTLPSAIGMALFAFLLKGYDIGGSGWIHGLKVVAVAIVAHAVFSMGSKLAADRIRATIAMASAAVVLVWHTAYTQVGVIVLSGLLGLYLFKNDRHSDKNGLPANLNKRAAIISLIAFFSLLFLLPVLREIAPHPVIALFDSFYRSGSLVFGGGHVVLPLLEMEVVPSGWVSQQDFLAGYGATQAMPGPLFTFSAYLGAMAQGTSGAVIALVAVFLPSFLLVTGALPFWDALRYNPKVEGALVSINASVVGILLAALYNPLWTNAIHSAKDFVLAMGLFGLLNFWKLPPWMIVVIGAAGGLLMF